MPCKLEMKSEGKVRLMKKLKVKLRGNDKIKGSHVHPQVISFYYFFHNRKFIHKYMRPKEFLGFL